MAIKAAFIHSEEVEKYHYPETSPFKTERAGKTKRILKSLGYYEGQGRKELAPIPATMEELLSFHAPEYLEALQRASKGNIQASDLFMGIGTEDCPVFSAMYDYSVLAAGGSITGARALLDGSVDMAFNPSGGYHHAGPEKAEGFCYVNDVVLACKILANSGKRVFCLDLDAHHGNGTQAAFYDDPRVFTVSFHESGKTLYPWGGGEDEIGIGEGAGTNMNIPFPAGTDDEIAMVAYNRLIPPLIKAWQPDVIVLELGMDVLSVDPLTHLKMTNNVIADFLPKVTQFEKPILALGGGGYSPEDASRGWALCWAVLCNIQMEEDLYMGLGGVFLGSAEWNAGLRDPLFRILGKEKEVMSHQMEKTVSYLEKNVLSLHGV